MTTKNIIKALFVSTIFCLLLSGCNNNSNNNSTLRHAEEIDNFDPNCILPKGVIFKDCVSLNWTLPSYYEMPIDNPGNGKEVFSHQEAHRFIAIDYITTGEDNKILDIKYGSDKKNALLRFRASKNIGYSADYREFSTGELQFDIKVLKWGRASDISVRVECSWPCTSDSYPLDIKSEDQWYSLSIPIQKMVSSGLDSSNIDSAINFIPTWNNMQGLEFQVDNIVWIKGPDPTSAPYKPKLNYRAAIKTDLNYIYTTTLENHPGSIDTENPNFIEYLEKGYKKSLSEAEKVTTLEGYKTTISEFMAGFSDPHFKVNFKAPESYYWPGFTARKVGNKYLIEHKGEDNSGTLPPRGSQILSCDDREIEKILVEDVLYYRYRKYNIDSVKGTYAKSIFLFDGIGDRYTYKTCSVLENGNKVKYKLSWQKITAKDRHTHLPNPQRYKPKYSSIEEIKEGVFWASLPNFLGPNEAEKIELNNVIKKIRSLPNDNTIIFDMRFNNGGNSMWGVNILSAALGSRQLERLYLEAGAREFFSEFRVSKGNLEYLSKNPEQESLFRSMTEAKINGQKWHSTKNKNGIFFQLYVAWIKLWKTDAPILPIVLTADNCVSACLNFVDLALLHPNAIHMGLETGVDTRYTDIRSPSDLLPSNLGWLVLPMKVWRKQLREDWQSYKPDFVYDNDIYNTPRVKRWVLEKVTNLKE